jgi:hypothetical protein
MQEQTKKNINASGQTLIETLAALFILVMGVSAAVGLAIYAFSTSGNIVKQITATGLAREGLEAVINMRDGNWLQDTLTVNGCYDFASSQANKANCYTHWLGTGVGGGSGLPYCIDPTSGASGCAGDLTTMNYSLGYLNNFSTISGPIWFLQRQSSPQYGMTFDPNNGNFFYSSDGASPCTSAPGWGPLSDYCRKITITKINNAAPYNQDPNLILLKVQSFVWWVDKKCPRSADWPGLGNCSLELDTYLTNWKNY